MDPTLDIPSQSNREGVPIAHPEPVRYVFHCGALLDTPCSATACTTTARSVCNSIVCARVLLTEISEHANEQDHTVRFAREEVLKLAGWAREW